MKFNERYFDELGNSSAVVNDVVDIAEQVAAAARASAPVDTREYVDSIHVEVERTSHRVIAKVVASSEHSLVVESRTGNLQRALRSAGNGG